MWLFGAGSTSGADEAKEEVDDEEAEVRILREEAEELRLKLEALEAADYRDQLREACAATAAAAPGIDAAGRQAAAPAAAWGDPSGAVEHYSMDDSSLEERELEAMYDFTSFAPGQVAMGVEPSAAGPGQLGPEEAAAAARRLRMVEAKLQEREAELSERVEEKERKLAAASRALQRTKGQVQQLNAQLGLKDIEGSRLQCQVSQLRGLLVDKERRLHEALDKQAATAAALTEARAAGASSSSQAPSEQAEVSSVLDEAAEDCGPQQPQEPPVACVAPPADEEQLLQMSRIAEQLTEALEVAREGEDEARRDLSETAARLQAEQVARAQYERELEAARRQRDLEVQQLLSRLQQQEQQLALERARAKEHEERASRAVIEDRLQQALAQKGKTQFYPHLEV